MQQSLKYIILNLFAFFSYCFCFSQITASYTINADGVTPQILTVKKHSKGFFLVGTTNGLYRFDGRIFTPYLFGDSAKSKSVTAIAEDKNSTVWLGFQNGEIGFLKDKTVELLQAPEGHPAVAITSILADTSGTIYFTTAGEGIYYYLHKRFYNINTDDGLSDNYVYEVLTDKEELVACTDRGINFINLKKGKKHIRSFTSVNGLPDNIVRRIYNKNNKNSFLSEYWLGMQDKGIGYYSRLSDHDSFSCFNTWTYGQINSLISSGRQLWIATEDKGILMLDFEEANMNKLSYITSFNTGYTKSDNLANDGEGNIWFTNSNHLIKTNGARLQNIIPFDEKLFSQIHSILQDRSGNIWINLNKGLAEFYFDNKIKKWRTKEFYIAQIDNKTDITSIYEDRFGNIWVGTMGKGIVIINPVTGKNRTVNEDELLIDGSVLSINGKGDEIWISTLAGAVHCNMGEENKNIFEKYTFINFKNVSSIGSNYIYSIFIDSKKRVWFATDGKGITVYENSRFKNYNKSNGIKSNVIYNICEDKRGNIWFSTLNNGLYKYDGKKFTNIGVENGLNDATITALTVDEKNNIIAITKKGINIINADTYNISYIDANEGVQNINTDLNCITGNNPIFFVSDHGILRYIPTEESLKPRIVLDAVKLFLKDINITQRGSYSYDENNFTFSYLGISYSHPDKIRYQYKLDGLSNEWITTKDNNINFPKLPPGKYTFHVRSSINNQFAGMEEVSYSFTIQQPFWLQWWFILLTLLVMLSALYLLIKVREKRVKRWERMEKEKIQSQFETLKSQVNPHFLFNSFNTLISVIEDDQQTAVEYVEHLSDLYRKIVTYRDKDVITIKEEIDIIKDYFFIQKKRFGDNLQFKNYVSQYDQVTYMIAPLTLQLLAENAVKHNAISSETPLLIELIVTEKILVVKNTVNPKLTSEKGEGMGLQNIQKRYKLLTKDNIFITKTDDFFIVKIPLLSF